MSLILTPGQFANRASFYHQLGQLTDAGISIPRAIESQFRAPPTRSYREPLRRMLTQLQVGDTFSEALMAQGKWVPEFDVALLRAGERSGRLPACFKLLDHYYQDRARMMQQVLSDLAYPVFLFHFAVLLGPIPALFVSGNFLAYGWTVGRILVPVYAIAAMLMFAGQARHGEHWRALIERVISFIPVARGAQQHLALARLTAALEALINAGVSIIETWELAASASGSPRLKRTVLSWRPKLESGSTPAELVTASGIFPDLFTSLYASGELTGKTDEELRHLHQLYLDSGTQKVRALSKAVPKIIYLGIVIMIAIRVLSFWSGYFEQVNQVL